MRVEDIKSVVKSKGFKVEEETCGTRYYITASNKYATIDLGFNVEKGIVIRFLVTSISKENVSDVYYSSKIAERIIEKAQVNINSISEALDAFNSTLSILI